MRVGSGNSVGAAPIPPNHDILGLRTSSRLQIVSYGVDMNCLLSGMTAC